jgi:histidine ammonia-lyase
LHSSALLESFVTAFRERVPFVQRDVLMHTPMEAALDFVRVVEVE